MRRRDRALANGLLGFVAMLVIAALLYTLFDPAVSDMLTMTSGQTSATEAQDAIDVREQIWNNVLLIPLFIGGLFIIAKAVVESRRPG